MSVLAVEDLSVRFGRGTSSTLAVNDVSFGLEAGQITALVGESGSGKSTVARVIAGLQVPSNGRVMATGLGRRDIQMVFQDPYASLNPRMTIGAMLDEACSLEKKSITVGQLAELVHLDPLFLGRFPHELSGGQRQRVAIARAIAVRPKVLLLDEVTASLDVTTQAAILRMMRELVADLQFACLFITHDLAVVQNYCDDLLVMLEGSIVERGSVERVLSAPQSEYTQRLLAAVPGALTK